MIPADRVDAIGESLNAGIGWREDVGRFVFTFAALPSGHDMDYALEELKKGDAEYRKAINIVLKGIT